MNFFTERLSLLNRALLLNFLGILAWALSFSRVWIFASSEWGLNGYLAVALAVLVGGCLVANTALYLKDLLGNGLRWIYNSRPVAYWLFLGSAYASTLIIQAIMQPDMLDTFLLSYMIVIHSIHLVRLAPPVALAVALAIGFTFAYRSGLEDAFLIGAFVVIQIVVLWSLGMGLLFEMLEAKKLKVRTTELTLATARLEEVSRREERRRLRQNLHDRMGHELAAININLQLIERSEHQKDPQWQNAHLRPAQKACRRLFGTLADVVDELKQDANALFQDQLRDMIDKVPGIRISLECDPKLSIRDPVVADQLMYCLQEGLTNILKHSDATKADIVLRQSNGQVEVSLRDNGSRPPVIEAGTGLNGMIHRMKRVGGRTLIRPGEERGVEIRIVLPAEILL